MVAGATHVVRSASGRGVRTLVLAVGPVTALVVALASVATGVTSASTDAPRGVLLVAVIALTIGIPHGAVDHLTLAPGTRHLGRLAIAYVVLAAAAIASIAIWPGPAFLAVIAMSCWHFGAGDVEADAELTDSRPVAGARRILEILALGCAPLLLPLTAPGTNATLQQIEPQLATLLSPTVATTLRAITLVLIAMCLCLKVIGRDARGAADLVTLALLGLVATPLVVFAVYFGAWHAVRHTGRLTLARDGVLTGAGLVRTFAAGMPAAVGFVFVVAIISVVVEDSTDVGSYLWWGLAVVWGLTVPHMLAVLKFDQARRRQAFA